MMNRLLGRPLLVKSLLWSCLLHAGAFGGISYWGSKPEQRFSFAGQRDVVRVEAAFSKSHANVPDDEILEVEQTLPTYVEADNPIAESVAALELSPQNLALKKREATVNIERLESDEALRDVVDFSAISVNVAGPARGKNESADPQINPVETSFQSTRQVVKLPTTLPTIAVEQVAGAEDQIPPDFLGNRPPSYPAEAIRRHLEGTVLLRLRIDARGRVERVEIVETSGHAILDRSAVQAIETWHGRPAYRAGQPVATIELLPVRFKF